MKFIADVMVGRLAKYLRMAGNNVIYVNDIDDDQLLKIAAAESRVVITRDTLMLERREFKNGLLKSIFIKDDKLVNQLKQVKSELKISLKPNLARCLVCNGLLSKVEKSDIKGKVPPYVYKTQDNFLFCKKCTKYYWRGTHYENIKNIFNIVNRTND